MRSWQLCAFLVANGLLGLMHLGACQTPPDPCTSSKPLDDPTLLTSYSLGTSETCVQMKGSGWFHYNTTSDGAIATACPSGTQCGTHNQIWINDSIPNHSDGARNVSICAVDGPNCCRKSTTLEVKNCSQFIVFRLTTFPGCNRLCFNDSGRPSTVLPPSHETTHASRASSLPRFGFKITLLLPVLSMFNFLS